MVSTADEAAELMPTHTMGQSILHLTWRMTSPSSTSTSTVCTTTRSSPRRRRTASISGRSCLLPHNTTRAVAWQEMSSVVAGALVLYNFRLASLAPSAMAAIFIQTMSSVMASALAVLAKPQSVPAMTRLGPTRAAIWTSRCAISSGCSTRGLVLSTTPGTMTLSPRRWATLDSACRSAPWRGLAISQRMYLALRLTRCGHSRLALMSLVCGPG
mmetsp:Transcript_42240/g.108022  ORF Transcript_42240/g.108022 Transcript_42240/m.108022 type:complete len:214 (-) Transcript_42240:1672-2313(-)